MTRSHSHSVSSASTASTADSIGPGRLPVWLIDSILELIEASGGISRCIGTTQHLASILNRDTETFGPPGHKIRRRIQQKVFDWQRLYRQGEYKTKILDTRSPPIVPFDSRSNNISRGQHITETSSVSDDDDTEEEVATKIDPVVPAKKSKRRKQGNANQKSPPPKEVRIDPWKELCTPLKSPPKSPNLSIPFSNLTMSSGKKKQVTSMEYVAQGSEAIPITIPPDASKCFVIHCRWLHQW